MIQFEMISTGKGKAMKEREGGEGRKKGSKEGGRKGKEGK